MRKLGTIIDRLKQGGSAPTRHENPYLMKALDLSSYLMTASEVESQSFPFFEDPRQGLILEIGCYLGKNILEFSQQNQNFNFIGLDITYKRGVKAAQKLKLNQISNAKIALCDGLTFLKEDIPDRSLQGVCVFFPDPWPKDRHAKNRLLKQDFVEVLKQKLSPNGFFWFKTDAQTYFETSDALLIENGFLVESMGKQPKLIQGGPYETAFQKLFREKGIPYYEKVYIPPR
jgi:tRNA (guanine-N7-)-methyltransferase